MLAIADASWRVVEQQRLTRTQFERRIVNRAVRLVVMEACGSVHHWARWLSGMGIGVRLLPAAYIRTYVKRNKTDAADACALLEAARCADITLGACLSVRDISDPVSRAPGKPSLLIFPIECCGCQPQKRGFNALKCVNADDRVEAAVDLRCNHGHHSAFGADVKGGCLRAEGVLRNA